MQKILTTSSFFENVVFARTSRGLKPCLTTSFTRGPGGVAIMSRHALVSERP